MYPSPDHYVWLWVGLALWFALITGLTLLRYWWRARAMRALAKRYGIQPLRKLPAGFYLRGLPLPKILGAWSVCSGRIGSIELLIFDAVLGGNKIRQLYCTIVACRTPLNPFGEDTGPGKRIRDGEWTAVYRTRIWATPGTLSIARVEGYLSRIQAASEQEWVDAPRVGRELL